MSETTQQKPVQTQEHVVEAPPVTAQTSAEPEVGEEDLGFDIDISDYIKENEGIAKHYKQKGGQ